MEAQYILIFRGLEHMGKQRHENFDYSTQPAMGLLILYCKQVVLEQMKLLRIEIWKFTVFNQVALIKYLMKE